MRCFLGSLLIVIMLGVTLMFAAIRNSSVMLRGMGITGTKLLNLPQISSSWMINLALSSERSCGDVLCMTISGNSFNSN